MLGKVRKLIIPIITRKHTIAPNFLTHVLWSKTILGK
jgi:hypothetical protein